MELADDECPICYNPIMQSAIFRPCVHTFCYACTQRALQRRMQCPLCRQIPTALEESTEDDAGEKKNIVTVNCKIRPQEHVGITLANASTGVKVLHLKTQDAAFRAGIRRNDVILSMNKLPCHSHKEAVQILNAVAIQAQVTKKDVQVTCAIKRRSMFNARSSNASSFYRSLASRMRNLRIRSTSND